jgi:hypothetical protein
VKEQEMDEVPDESEVRGIARRHLLAVAGGAALALGTGGLLTGCRSGGGSGGDGGDGGEGGTDNGQDSSDGSGGTGSTGGTGNTGNTGGTSDDDSGGDDSGGDDSGGDDSGGDDSGGDDEVFSSHRQGSGTARSGAKNSAMIFSP